MPVEALAGGALALAVSAAARHELRRRDELVAHACHEARRPLTAANLVLATMSRTGEASGERAGALGSELRRAAAALDDLTAARRGRRGTVRRDVVDVDALLADLAREWALPAAAVDRVVALAGDLTGVRVLGDGRRLAQALGNLVANALEHGAGPVEVRARRALGGVRIDVVDGGPGLYAPVRALARRPRPPARGRGLAIVAAIARAHRGRLVVVPHGHGALLALELPALGAGDSP